MITSSANIGVNDNCALGGMVAGSGYELCLVWWHDIGSSRVATAPCVASQVGFKVLLVLSDQFHKPSSRTNFWNDEPTHRAIVAAAQYGLSVICVALGTVPSVTLAHPHPHLPRKPPRP